MLCGSARTPLVWSLRYSSQVLRCVERQWGGAARTSCTCLSADSVVLPHKATALWVKRCVSDHYHEKKIPPVTTFSILFITSGSFLILLSDQSLEISHFYFEAFIYFSSNFISSFGCVIGLRVSGRISRWVRPWISMCKPQSENIILLPKLSTSVGVAAVLQWLV